MIVIILEKPKPSLKGLLSRWLFEVHTGVFVGKASARVRDKLWERIIDWSGPQTAAIMVEPDTQEEQGFRLRLHGTPDYVIRNKDGLKLVTRGYLNRRKSSQRLQWYQNQNLPRREWGEEWPLEIDPVTRDDYLRRKGEAEDEDGTPAIDT